MLETQVKPDVWVVGAETPQEIGVTFTQFGTPAHGIVKAVKWDAQAGTRNVEVESWRAIGDGRFSWWQAWYYADELTLDLGVRRPVEALNALDCALATDDGSERRAAMERYEQLSFYMNGY